MNEECKMPWRLDEVVTKIISCDRIIRYLVVTWYARLSVINSEWRYSSWFTFIDDRKRAYPIHLKYNFEKERLSFHNCCDVTRKRWKKFRVREWESISMLSLSGPIRHSIARLETFHGYICSRLKYHLREKYRFILPRAYMFGMIVWRI